jgi:hypothetical protein
VTERAGAEQHSPGGPPLHSHPGSSVPCRWPWNRWTSLHLQHALAAAVPARSSHRRFRGVQATRNVARVKCGRGATATCAWWVLTLGWGARQHPQRCDKQERTKPTLYACHAKHVDSALTIVAVCYWGSACSVGLEMVLVRWKHTHSVRCEFRFRPSVAANEACVCNWMECSA